jgi:UDP-N-acetylglucosamine/UDP-N-acetylgalactosamine diphosphorylase
MNEKVKALIAKGVRIPNPDSVDIGDEVDIAKIASGVTIFSGCKIYGKKTVIMAKTKLGQEGPVTIQDCQIGREVELGGGFFKESVFLDRSSMACGAYVRDACILEEEANGAHTVGLKHTILLPFVTLGSLINFCDCLMAGGTSRKDHSEVGSSYIHFNYTPNQDKATASLIGDVPRGVMLDQRPIFLGGQGGLVGPSIIGFGTVIAAGTVFRGDIPDGKIVMGQAGKTEEKDFIPDVYWEIKRKIRNNITYTANIIALKAWYTNVRCLFFGSDAMSQALLNGSIEKLDMALDERIKRLAAIAKKMPNSLKEYQQIMDSGASQELIKQKQELLQRWNEVEELLNTLCSSSGKKEELELFIKAISVPKGQNSLDYITFMQGLSKETRSLGTTWLSNIVNEVETTCIKKLPSFA